MSNTIVIQTAAKRHLGFLLLAGGPDAGDCIFRSMPMAAEDFDLPESAHLYALQQQGECEWRHADGDLVITGQDGKVVGELRDGGLKTGPYTLIAFGTGDAR